MKYIYLEDGILNGAGEVLQLDEYVKNIEVNDEIYENFVNEPLKYIYSDGKIIENPQFEKIKQQELNEQRKIEIQNQLQELDNKRIRAICEDEIKDEKTGETWLEYYNAQIYQLRNELQSLA